MDVLSTLPVEGPVTLIAEFTARPGRTEDVRLLLNGLAEQVRREEGNVAFDCFQRLDNDACFVVYEIYRDKAAFAAHIEADYGAVFNAALRGMIVEPNSVLTFLMPTASNIVR